MRAIKVKAYPLRHCHGCDLPGEVYSTKGEMVGTGSVRGNQLSRFKGKLLCGNCLNEGCEQAAHDQTYEFWMGGNRINDSGMIGDNDYDGTRRMPRLEPVQTFNRLQVKISPYKREQEISPVQASVPASECSTERMAARQWVAEFKQKWEPVFKANAEAAEERRLKHVEETEMTQEQWHAQYVDRIQSKRPEARTVIF